MSCHMQMWDFYEKDYGLFSCSCHDPTPLRPYEGNLPVSQYSALLEVICKCCQLFYRHIACVAFSLQVWLVVCAVLCAAVASDQI